MTQGLAQATAGGLTAEAAGGFLAKLFDQHGTRVYGLCRLLLRDPVEAEDAAQQTFLSAYRSLLSGHTPREPAVWLSTIARNECRARIRARVTELLAPIDEDQPAADDLEDVAAARAEIEALYEALAELSQPQREAIVLRELHGLSYDEVGAASGIPASAVKSVLFRARRRLQARLRSLGFVPSVIPVPLLALRDSLAQAIPGFASASAATGSAATLASLPLAMKVAGATMSVAVVGAIGGAAVEQRDLHAPALERTKGKPAATAGVRDSVDSSAPERGRRPLAVAPVDPSGVEDEQAEAEANEAEEEEPESATVEGSEQPALELGGGSGERAEDGDEGDGGESEKSSED